MGYTANYTIGDLLERRERKNDLVSISQHALVKTATDKMSNPKLAGVKSIRRIAVIKREDDPTMVGILTETDVTEKLRALDREEDSVRVKTIMTHSPVTIDINESPYVARAKMVEGSFGSLPVTEYGRVKTVISEHDLLVFLNYVETKKAQQESYERHQQ